MSNIPMKRLIVGEGDEAFEVMDAHAVHFDGPQYLNDLEKAQVIENLGLTNRSTFAYNFKTVNECSYDKKDVAALRHIMDNWRVEPMSIYICGWPVIGVIPGEKQFRCLYKNRTIQTFEYKLTNWGGDHIEIKAIGQTIIPDEKEMHAYADATKPFFVPFTSDEEGNVTTTVTLEEIGNAFNAGLSIYAIVDGTTRLPLTQYDGEEAIFLVNAGEGVLWLTLAADGTTTFQMFDLTPAISASAYLVESGTKDSWTYEKWSNGLAKCWKNVTDTIKTTEWVGDDALFSFGLYWARTEKPVKLAYPFEFDERPVENVDIANGTAWFPIQTVRAAMGDTNNTDAYRLLTYKKPEQDMRLTFSFSVTGKWKMSEEE